MENTRKIIFHLLMFVMITSYSFHLNAQKSSVNAQEISVNTQEDPPATLQETPEERYARIMKDIQKQKRLMEKRMKAISNNGNEEIPDDIDLDEDITQKALDENTCFFDKQMCTVQASSKMARLTSSMLGTSLRSSLGDNWIYTDKLYPIPNMGNMPRDEPMHVAMAPAYLREISATDFDTYSRIRYCFQVSNANGVLWKCRNGRVSIRNTEDGIGTVRLLSVGWDTLIAYKKMLFISEVWDGQWPNQTFVRYDTSIKEAAKTIPINITSISNDDCGYTLTLVVRPDSEAGIVSGEGGYEEGEKAIIKAAPNPCYRFVHWLKEDGTIFSTKQTDTLTMMQDSTLYAVFARNDFSLFIYKNIEEGGNIETRYLEGCNIVEVTVRPAPCYKFIHYKSVSGTPLNIRTLDTLSLINDSSIIAVFEKDSFMLSAIARPEGAGNVNGTGTFECGITTKIKAVATDTCYQFSYWEDVASGIKYFEGAEIDVIVNAAKSLIAVFDFADTMLLQLETYPPDINVLLGGSGYFTKCNSSTELGVYIYDPCIKFDYWSNKAGDTISTTTNPLIRLQSDSTLVAHFAVGNFNVTLTPSPSNGGLVNNQTYFDTNICNDRIRIEAVANTTPTNFSFVSWTESSTGNIISENPIDTIMIDSDLHLIANFVENLYVDPVRLTLYVEPVGTGKVSGNKIYERNSEVTAVATPNDCYAFLHWKDASEKIISSDANYKFNLSKDSILIAVFTKIEYRLTINVTPTYMGEVTGAETGYHPCKETLKLQATTNNSETYEFIRWDDEHGNIIGTDANLNLLLVSDTTIFAIFGSGISEEDNVYDIRLVPNPTDRDFTIFFNNPLEQKVSIELLDLAGSKILSIFDGTASADTLIYKISEKLASGTYFIQFTIKDKVIMKKLVVK